MYLCNYITAYCYLYKSITGALLFDIIHKNIFWERLYSISIIYYTLILR